MKSLSFLLLFPLFFLSACQQKAIEWPALTALDELSIEIEKAAYDHNHSEEKELLKKSQKLIQTIGDTVPENVQNAEMLNLLIVDLQSISTQITQLDQLDHDQKNDLSLSIHPLVAVMMKTAGVPHTHKTVTHTEANCDEHDH